MGGKRQGDTLTIGDKLKAALVPVAEQPYPIPENWIWAKMRVLMPKSTRTIDPSKYANEIFESYSVPSFPSGEPEIIQGNKVGSSKQVVEPNDVLLCKINPRINRVWVVGEKRDYRQIASTEWIVLRGGGNTNPNYIGFALQSSYFRDIFAGNVSGVGGSLTRARPKDAALYPVPIASLSEQNRIADKLASLLGKIKKAKALLDEIPQILQNFRQTVLAAACSGRLTEDWRISKPKESDLSIRFEQIRHARKKAWMANEIRKKSVRGPIKERRTDIIYLEPVKPEHAVDLEKPETWLYVAADEITFLITDGKHGDCEDAPNSGYYFMSVKDLYQGRLHYENARQIRKEDFLEVHYRTSLEIGDVLVTNAGTIGRVAVANDFERVSRTTFQKSIAVLKPVREIVMSEYLAFFIESSVLRLQKRSSGTAVKNLLLRDLRQIPVALPSIGEQAEIVRRVESIFKKADDLEAQYKEAMVLIETLPEIILSKAFRGELVPQDPNDEPAIKLLEKVLKEKESVKVSIDVIAVGRPEIMIKKDDGGSQKRSLLAVLKEKKDHLTPEELFRKAGYNFDDLDDVEAFYAELSKEVREKRIKELRLPSSKAVTLERAI